MRILSWNILACEWIERKEYKGIDKKILFNREKRFIKVCEILKNLNAEIILLQEVMSEEYEILCCVFKDYIVSGLLQIDWGEKMKRNSGNVTLLKRDKFKNGVLNEYMDYSVITKSIYKGKKLSIYNIHLSDTSLKERYKEINRIRSLSLKDELSIIGGDFNHEYRMNSTLYKIEGYKVHNKKCYTYYLNRKMNIDNILSKGFKENKENICVKYPETIEKGLKEYGSDHLPIIVELDI